MVLQAHHAGRGAFPRAEVAAGEDRDARAREPQDHEEERGEGVQPDVEREVREADREDQGLRRAGNRGEAEGREYQAQQGGEGKEEMRDEAEAAGREKPRETDGEPGGRDGERPIDRGEHPVHIVSTVELR